MGWHSVRFGVQPCEFGNITANSPSKKTAKGLSGGHLALRRGLVLDWTKGRSSFEHNPTGGGAALGFIEEVSLEETSVDLRGGDLLVLYTDGITDANSTTGEFYGMRRLCETVCAAGGLAAGKLCDHIFAVVDRFQAGAVQYDDMALLVVEVNAEDKLSFSN